MVVGIEDALKLICISIMACCAVFVCTLFLSYNIDIAKIRSAITSEAGLVLYEAQVSMGKVVCIVSGACLAATTVVMLIFYIKNYIDTHGKELGILKALGYSNFGIAKHFWVFALSVFIGCAVGFCAGYIYLPTFYKAQNADGILPEIHLHFHTLLAFLLIGAPTLLYLLLSILYAYCKLKSPVLDLLKERKAKNIKGGKDNDLTFLQDLKKNTVRSKKILVFLVAFSAFCFSAMTQMSISMNELTSNTFAVMILTIGLILAFTTLALSLSSIVKANAKTIAMMRVFGYTDGECSRAVLWGYRPFAYIGFALGTGYQYALLKLVMTFIFSDFKGVAQYHFSWFAFAISLGTFLIVYESAIYLYSQIIRKTSVKIVMDEL